MEVPTKCNEFRRPALRFVQNLVKRHCTLSCRPKTRCENATSFSKKWGSSSQNKGTFSSLLCTCSSALTEFTLRRGSRTTRSALLVLSSRPLDFHLHPPRRFHLADTPLHTRRDRVRALHRVSIFYVHPSPRS